MRREAETTKLDMGGVHKERFGGLVYHQGASIRYKRVEASNSCARTLIFGFFLLLSFVKFFSCPFSLFDLAFYCIFSFLDLVFYRPLFSPFFFALILFLFFGSCGFISSLP
jgi:hypothetical protein